MQLDVIYNEDCLLTMSRFSCKSIDLILTDPPYGINLQYDLYEDTEENWYNLIKKTLPEMLRVAKMVILPSCQIKRLKWIYDHFPPDWLICWYKGSVGHCSFIGFNDWEPHLVYGRRINRLYMHDYFQTKSSPKKESFGHPCPKPLEWATWLISRVAREEKIVVYDPFVGSGTTALAAKLLGHNYIGSEISSNYCNIANNRINNELQRLHSF